MPVSHRLPTPARAWIVAAGLEPAQPHALPPPSGGQEVFSVRKGYNIGWGSVLDVYAGRRSAAFVIFAILSGAITVFLKITGRFEASIERAGGRIPAKSS